MNRIHVLVASVIVGLSAIFGLAATTKTVGIGQAKPAASQVSDQSIAARKRKLNRAQVALRKARARKPPSSPLRPDTAPLGAGERNSSPRLRPVERVSAPSFSRRRPPRRRDDHDDEGDDD